jgi:uncharacterized protein (TIGR03000 family)
MYSAVLMLALTAGSETVDFGRNRGNGCASGYGCSGVVVNGGCSGAYGCSVGNGGHGCSGRRGLFGGHGCNGGGGLFGGRGGHGCNGGGLFSGRGGHGCNGGGLFGGRHGCNGGGYVCSGNGYVCSGGAPVCSGGTVVTPPPAGKPLPKSEPIPEPKKKAQSAAPATIIVSLPADARLFVDGSATTSTSARRTLVTPELAFGQTYAYTMRVEVVRDGQVQAQTQQVNVIGGQIANVQFNLSSQGVASR